MAKFSSGQVDFGPLAIYTPVFGVTLPPVGKVTIVNESDTACDISLDGATLFARMTPSTPMNMIVLERGNFRIDLMLYVKRVGGAAANKFLQAYAETDV